MPQKKSPPRRSSPAKSAGRGKAGGAAYFGFWMGLAAIIAVADQYTKTLVLGYYKLGDITHVSSFFNVTRLHNPGAAFSFLADAGGWQRWFFVVLALAVSVWCWLTLRRERDGRIQLAFALIIGGALLGFHSIRADCCYFADGASL